MRTAYYFFHVSILSFFAHKVNAVAVRPQDILVDIGRVLW